MKTKGIIIFLVLMILVSFIPANLSEAEEQDQEGVICFFKANEYLDMPEEVKIIYVTGLIDAVFICLEAFEKERYQEYREATKGMILEQLQKIFNKYLEKHPENLHYDAATCFIWALDEIMDK